MKVVIFLFALAASGLPALAEESAPARTVDFAASVAGIDGKPYVYCVQATEDQKGCAKTEAMSLGKMAAAALSVPDRNTSIIEQVHRGKLAQQLLDAKSEALGAKDLTLVEEQIGKLGLSPVVVYHAVEMLDPAAVK